MQRAKDVAIIMSAMLKTEIVSNIKSLAYTIPAKGASNITAVQAATPAAMSIFLCCLDK